VGRSHLDRLALDRLVAAVGIEEELTFTGGVAMNLGMVKALEENLGLNLNVSAESHYMGALGAALFALDNILASRAPSGMVGERL